MSDPRQDAKIDIVGEHACFGGVQGFYRHRSAVCGCDMRFSVFRPPPAGGDRPVLYFLAGLTCTEETFMVKAGAQRLAAENGLILVAPDTSPRATGIAGEGDDWDFGAGAGFYLDATRAPWSQHYRMYSYVVAELPRIVLANFPARADAQGIFGHSMGGHGALIAALRNPTLYRSVSAFAPVVAPTRVPWGQKAFHGYLGSQREEWNAYDATALVRERPFGGEILIDQGLADTFLDDQLRPDLFIEACREVGQPLRLRKHPGYDHSYYFISTFIGDHLRHHAKALLS
jgi:S-formylglutathione hydrolase